jgi:hypothetical protein
MMHADTTSDATRPFAEFLSSDEGRRILSLIRIRMGFPEEAFALAVRPLIERWARHCDSPVDPSGEHTDETHAELLRALVRVLRALDLRRQRILPPNAAPEELGALAHRWTFAVVTAALLHDLSERDAELAASLLGEALPELVKHWLSEDPFLHQLLLATVKGEHRRPNPMAEIVCAAMGGSGSEIRKAGPGSETTNSATVAPEPDESPGAEARSGSGEPRGVGSPQVAWPPGSAGEFFIWLKNGFAAGSINVNGPNSLVHRVPEGLLLVSPGIFRSFLAASGRGAISADALKELQRAVFKASGLLAADSGGNFHGYAWRGAESGRRPVHGIVVTDPHRLLDPDRPMNNVLARVETAPGKKE